MGASENMLANNADAQTHTWRTDQVAARPKHERGNCRANVLTVQSCGARVVKAAGGSLGSCVWNRPCAHRTLQFCCAGLAVVDRPGCFKHGSQSRWPLGALRETWRSRSPGSLTWASFHIVVAGGLREKSASMASYRMYARAIVMSHRHYICILPCRPHAPRSPPC